MLNSIVKLYFLTFLNDILYQFYMGNSESRPIFLQYTLIAGLQAELQAAYKEGEAVKKKLKLQEAEMEALRAKHSEKEDNLATTYSKYLTFTGWTSLIHYSNLFYYSWVTAKVRRIIAKA